MVTASPMMRARMRRFSCTRARRAPRVRKVTAESMAWPLGKLAV
jgi:hypothetical protein